MKIYSILTVDLNESVSTDKRQKFYDALKEKKWTRIPELTTLWYSTWQDGTTEDGIVNTTKEDVDSAAKSAGVDHYDASVAACCKPVVWKK